MDSCTETFALSDELYQCILLCLCLYQVKPLLQVTNTEEKLNKKENELRVVTEHLSSLRGEHDSLTTEHQQLISDKMLVTEQLRAEQDLCAETEEVLCSAEFYTGFCFRFVVFFYSYGYRKESRDPGSY